MATTDRLTVRQIIRAVSEVSCVHENDMTGPSRLNELVWARDAVVWIAVDQLGPLYSKIGRALNRDHSTISSAKVRAEQRYADDDTFRLLVRITLRGLKEKPMPQILPQKPTVYINPLF